MEASNLQETNPNSIEPNSEEAAANPSDTSITMEDESESSQDSRAKEMKENSGSLIWFTEDKEFNRNLTESQQRVTHFPANDSDNYSDCYSTIGESSITSTEVGGPPSVSTSLQTILPINSEVNSEQFSNSSEVRDSEQRIQEAPVPPGSCIPVPDHFYHAHFSQLFAAAVFLIASLVISAWCSLLYWKTTGENLRLHILVTRNLSIVILNRFPIKSWN